MNKKLIIPVILSLALLTLIISGWNPFSPKVVTENNAIPFQEYSLSSEVVLINAELIKVNAAVLKNGPEGNYIGFETKTVKINPDIQVRELINRNGDVLIQNASLSDIKTGQNITLYSSEDMSVLPEFGVNRIDIQN